MNLTLEQAARRLLRRRHYGVLSTTALKFPAYPYGSFVAIDTAAVQAHE